jgi:cobalt/nickel transport system permease protein
MSHIHLPDGILPVWLWVLGWILMVGLLFIFRSYFQKRRFTSKIPLVATFSAIMVISMSLEIVPILYHINLSVVSAIILGPGWFILCSFVVNLILAFFGHGGITVVGLNSLVITAEGIFGYFLFKTLWSIFKKIFWAGFVSTFLALFLSTLFALGIVALGTFDLSKAFGIGEKLHSKTDKGFLKFETKEVEKQNEEPLPQFDFRKFLFLVLGFSSIGWVLEGLVTAGILRYLHKVRPGIFEGY